MEKDFQDMKVEVSREQAGELGKEQCHVIDQVDAHIQVGTLCVQQGFLTRQPFMLLEMSASMRVWPVYGRLHVPDIAPVVLRLLSCHDITCAELVLMGTHVRIRTKRSQRGERQNDDRCAQTVPGNVQMMYSFPCYHG